MWSAVRPPLADDRPESTFERMSLALALLCALQAPIAFTHATLIDGRDSTPRRDQTVIVRGNKIASVGAAGTIRVPANATVIDARGKYLIPGLWDMHVHTTIVGGRELLAL